jgi:cell division protein FtsB
MKTEKQTRVRPLEMLARHVRRNTNGIIFAACALLLLQDVFGAHGVLAMRRSQREADHIRQEINRLNDENRRLQQRVESLRTDPAAIECVAREEMGLSRPGDFVLKIAPNNSAGPQSDPCAAPPENPPAR